MTARPWPFEPHRLLRAVRGNARSLAIVVLFALFAGAALARVAIANRVLARATVRIVREPHRVVSLARRDDVLAEALRRAGQSRSPEALAVEFDFRPPDRLHVALPADSDPDSALALVNALVALYVEHANRAVDARVAATVRARNAQLAAARAEFERARGVLSAALAREGRPDLATAMANARARLEELEQSASEAKGQLTASENKLQAVSVLSRSQAQSELATAQRDLSSLLAQHGRDHPEVVAARKRLERLQGQTVEITNAALKQRLEASGHAAEARVLSARTERQRAELAQLQQVSARIAPLAASAEQAQARLSQLEARADTAQVERSAVLRPASLHTVDRSVQRMLASLVAGVVAALAMLGFFALAAVRGFRVCAPTELAYWLGVPVLTSSAWPGRSEALESLVDELADPAIAARGVALVLPLSEAERPLAATLCMRLNARAQRHFRSSTGSRITIAQPWLGELGSTRIKRAAEAADRVLWIVAADAHRGTALRHCRDLVGRHDGVAALLVDAESSSAPRVGNTRAFWSCQAIEVVSGQVTPR